MRFRFIILVVFLVVCIKLSMPPVISLPVVAEISVPSTVPTVAELEQEQLVLPTREVQVTPTPTPTPGPVRVTNPWRPGEFQKGVAIVVYGKNPPYFKENIEVLLDRLARLGINNISLTFPIFQKDWKATEVYVDTSQTPSRDTLTLFIREAHKRGFRATLRPLLDEKGLGSGYWRGNIQPHDSGMWFASYTDLLVKYAEFAQEAKVEGLSIGVEFISLETERDKWLALIRRVRQVYKGSLVYSTNFVGSQVTFWPEVDEIGVDAFFELPELSEKATTEQIEAALKPRVEILKDLERFKKPIVFTEIGVASQSGSFRYPWRFQVGASIDLEAQRRYYAAVCQSSKSPINGLYWWSVEYYTLPNPLTDAGFNPMGKPAEEEIQRCFSSSSLLPKLNK